MDRATMKILSHGQFVITRRGETIVQRELDAFVEGALYAYDMNEKIKTEIWKIKKHLEKKEEETKDVYK